MDVWLSDPRFLRRRRLVKLSVGGNRFLRIYPVKRLRLPHSSTGCGSSIQVPDGRSVVEERLKMRLLENEEGEAEAETNLVFPWVFSRIGFVICSGA